MRGRIRLALRLTALLLIVVGPIGAAAWQMRPGAGAWADYPEVGAGTADAEVVARYLATRRPEVDRLLPPGSGGVRFFRHLGGNAGMAFSHSATIGLVPREVDTVWPEAVELHERAHLVAAFAGEAVTRLMIRVAPAASGEYAATDPDEHFAEMAAGAWQIVVEPQGVCVDGTPENRLREREARVPGTAGFVAWYLRDPALRSGAAPALAALAERLSAAQRSEWTAIQRIVDGRRRADGTLEPWRRPTIREYLASRRAEAWRDGGVLGWFQSLALIPSEALMSVISR